MMMLFQIRNMMLVHKRSGSTEPVSKSKVQRFLTHAGALKTPELVNTIMKGLPSKITSDELITYFANTVQAAGYSDVAGRIEMIAIHKKTSPSFTATMLHLPLSENFKQKIKKLRLDNHILHENDFTYDLFSIRTLERSYLMKNELNQIVERPQYMLMRVAASLYEDTESILSCYRRLSKKEYTHATPTLFNAGMDKGQYASCFLGVMQEDSIMGIFNTVKQCALISKTAGGIGLSISNVRASGAHIKGAMGKSSGLVPMLRVFNETARYVDQGRRRKGSFAMYLEPWHSDIEDFLNLRKNHGDENSKARDLFTALWVPDLFMERVRSDGEWTLFCPSTANFQDYHSEEFNAMYLEAEQTKPGRRIRARDLWEKIIRSQIETGTPYIMFKDRVNSCSNQQHLGTIKGSNLCAEVALYTSPDEIAVCTLASVALPKFASTSFDFKALGECVSDVVRHLDRVVDVTYYPLKEARKSNMRHRPLGIGVQGLSDVFQTLNIP
jgi:ribonucleoside-diphosphate reductase alpha chain